MPGKITNPYYKAFLDGYLLEQIDRNDIIKVIDNIEPGLHTEQARCLVIVSWASGARPNEYLRLTPECFNHTKEFLEIKMPGSKGSSARIVSLPCLHKDGSQDILTTEVYEYVRKLFPTQYLFWFYRSESKRTSTSYTYMTKNKEIFKKTIDKTYSDLGSKLRYYFSKWFDIIFPGGIPPYYLRHNRATSLLNTTGREATIMNHGWKTEATLKRYSHNTKKMRKAISEGLMQ